MIDKCPVCESAIPQFEFSPHPDANTVHCSVCGPYVVSEQFLLSRNTNEFRPDLVSGALREHNLRRGPYKLLEVTDLVDSVWIPQNPIEQIDKLLLALELSAGYFGEPSTLDCYSHYSFAYAKHSDEFYSLLMNAKDMGYISATESYPSSRVQLLWKGAKRLAELHTKDVNSNQAFVAMWFDPSMDDSWIKGIKPALEDTKYKPLRIDNKEHNNKIDDEIIAAIRMSGLVIADVTGHRQGVYYEAGYAKGLGIQVIWTCAEDQIDAAHFDTRQYSHVLWKTPEDLRKKLVSRIEATRPNRVS